MTTATRVADHRTPRYLEVAGALRAGVVAGTYPVGTRLPSERELMDAHGIARGTARQAIRVLVEEGTAGVSRGSRPVVLGPPPPAEQTMSELLSFTTWARSLGHRPGGRVESLVSRSATRADSERLGVEPGATLWELVRVRFLGRRPVMIERSVYPAEVGARLLGADLARVSITELLVAAGVDFARARHTIDAVAADADDAALLGLEIGEPLLRVKRTATSSVGEPLEWGEDRYRADAVAFVVENAARQPAARRTAPSGDEPASPSVTAPRTRRRPDRQLR